MVVLAKSVGGGRLPLGRGDDGRRAAEKAIEAGLEDGEGHCGMFKGGSRVKVENRVKIRCGERLDLEAGKIFQKSEPGSRVTLFGCST